MHESLTIWVVEDTKIHATEAFKTLKEIGPAADELGMEPVPFWIMNFSWPPFQSLRKHVDLSADAITSSGEYPDIVILDLMNNTSDGEKLEGNSFYRELRKWERHSAEKNNLSFVVLWSLYQGGKATAAFVKDARETDQRVIPIPSKQPALLKTTMIDLIRRVKEERENR